jgi:hypothetical protein
VQTERAREKERGGKRKGDERDRLATDSRNGKIRRKI